MTTFAKFLSDDSGATALEYGILAAGIALGIIAAVNSIGKSLAGTFAKIAAAL